MRSVFSQTDVVGHDILITEGDATRVATAAGIDIHDRYRGVPSEHDVALALAGLIDVVGVRKAGSDDEIVDAIAVNIPGRGNAPAGTITFSDAVEDKAVASVQGRQLQRGPGT